VVQSMDRRPTAGAAFGRERAGKQHEELRRRFEFEAAVRQVAMEAEADADAGGEPVEDESRHDRGPGKVDRRQERPRVHRGHPREDAPVESLPSQSLRIDGIKDQPFLFGQCFPFADRRRAHRLNDPRRRIAPCGRNDEFLIGTIAKLDIPVVTTLSSSCQSSVNLQTRGRRSGKNGFALRRKGAILAMKIVSPLRHLVLPWRGGR